MTTEVAKAPETGLSTNVGKPRGFIPDDQDLMVLPVAKILQKLSPEVEDGLEGAAPGVLWDPIEKKPLSDTFVPIDFYQEAVLWKDRKEGGRSKHHWHTRWALFFWFFGHLFYLPILRRLAKKSSNSSMAIIFSDVILKS